MNSVSIILLFSMSILAMAMAGPVDNQILIGESNPSPSLMQIFTGENKTAATCFDPNLASYIDYGLKYFSQNMGKLANSILNQIKSAGYAGFWLVHAEMIAGQQQHVRWDSVATGDIFQPSSRNGCYYHDGQTYIIILRY